MANFDGEFDYGFRTTEEYYNTLLGQSQSFTDNTVSETGVQGIESGMTTHAILVENSSATVPDPGTVVLWDDSAVGKKISGLAGADSAAAGVVDPTLLTGPAQNEKFLLFVKGPVDAMGGEVVAVGAKVKTGASGKLVTNPAAAVADLVGGCGRAIEALAADTLGRVYVDFTMNK